MKNLFFSVILLASAVSGASAAGAPASPAAEKVVCATTFPLYLFTRNIVSGAKNVRLELVVPPNTGCPHDYALTPRDLRKLSAPGLILVMNGLGLDDFILKPLAKVNPSAVKIDSSAGTETLAYGGCKHEHGHKHEEHGHEHEHGRCASSRAPSAGGNPHLFASPFTARNVVAGIASGLEKADPENAALYRKNAAEYLAELDRLAGEFRAAAPLLKGKKIVTQHGVFDYLAAGTGLVIVGTLSGGADSAPGAREMARLAGKIRSSGVKAVFTEPQYSARSARTLARECGIAVAELDPVANGPADAPADYYGTVMRKNLEILKGALAK